MSHICADNLGNLWFRYWLGAHQLSQAILEYSLTWAGVHWLVYLGLQFKWNQNCSKNSRHTSYIRKGLHAGKWSNDLETRFCQCTGIPLGRLHWNHTGWCYHPVVFQWQYSVNLHNWSILEDHWRHKYIGMPLEPTGWCYHPVVSQWQSSVNFHNWNALEDHWEATGRPLEAHWKHIGYQQFFLQWHSSVH